MNCAEFIQPPGVFVRIQRAKRGRPSVAQARTGDRSAGVREGVAWIGRMEWVPESLAHHKRATFRWDEYVWSVDRRSCWRLRHFMRRRLAGMHRHIACNGRTHVAPSRVAIVRWSPSWPTYRLAHPGTSPLPNNYTRMLVGRQERKSPPWQASQLRGPLPNAI